MVISRVKLIKSSKWLHMALRAVLFRVHRTRRLVSMDAVPYWDLGYSHHFRRRPPSAILCHVDARSQRDMRR